MGCFIHHFMPLTRMRYETGSDQLSHHDRQIGRDSHHTVLQIIVQLCAIICDFNHLQEDISSVNKLQEMAGNNDLMI